MKDLLPRLVSGIALGLLAVATVLYSSVPIFKLTVASLSATAGWEVFRLFRKNYPVINGVLASVIVFILSVVFLFFNFYLALLLVFVVSFFLSVKRDITTLALYILGFSYTVFFVSSLGIVHQIDKYLVLVLFATVWAGDTMAYFVGKTVGKRKLAPKLSPKKTWEGAVGGFLGGVVIGQLVAIWLGLQDTLIPIIIGSVVMQVGDLFESFLKRQIGVKDISNIIPGHGGILDRIDGLIFASVVFAFYYS
ncbi:MAG: phosphatidate cytidylyltransferase [Aquificae bacterium]|nr:phosphatidate cytidylyltransferase [Aquificota bacterium]